MFDRGRLISLLAILLALTLTIESFIRLRVAQDESAIPTEMQSLDMVSIQLRRAMANLVWMRLDDYLHSADVLVFKNKSRDGQQITGVSARNSAAELYPLARLVTMLDPAFVRAGITVGSLLMRDTAQQPAGSEFMRGMIRANPDHPRLYALFASIGMNRWGRKDYRGARPYLQRALDLYPRVNDAAKLALYGDLPKDDDDETLRRNVQARLVHCVTMLEDYEAALELWRKSEGFDPRNKVVRVLMMYRRMKAQGNVDREELSAEMAKQTREEQERSRKIGEQGAIADAPAGLEQAKKATDDRENFSQSQTAASVRSEAQPWQIVNLPRMRDLVIKLLSVIGLAAAFVFLGRRGGWLHR